MTRHRVVFITASSQEEAQRIARTLVEERLAACVNILPGIRSVYRWKGQIHEDPEVLLTAKTAGQMLDPLIQRVKQLHSYEVPEIIALPILAGAEDYLPRQSGMEYLSWIDEQTAPDS